MAILLLHCIRTTVLTTQLQFHLSLPCMQSRTNLKNKILKHSIDVKSISNLILFYLLGFFNNGQS